MSNWSEATDEQLKSFYKMYMNCTDATQQWWAWDIYNEMCFRGIK